MLSDLDEKDRAMEIIEKGMNLCESLKSDPEMYRIKGRISQSKEWFDHVLKLDPNCQESLQFIQNHKLKKQEDVEMVENMDQENDENKIKKSKKINSFWDRLAFQAHKKVHVDDGEVLLEEVLFNLNIIFIIVLLLF